MELHLIDANQIIDAQFGEWISQKICTKLLSSIKDYYLGNWDKYLTTSNTLTRLYTQQYKTSDILTFAANNLVCKGVAGDITIKVDNTKFVPGFDRLNLLTIVKTINYGTLDTKGCPIFTDVFNEFSEHIDEYVRMYYRV